MRERTLAGLARARNSGRVGGRPKASENRKLVAAVAKLRAGGKSIRVIANELGVAPGTVFMLITDTV